MLQLFVTLSIILSCSAFVSNFAPKGAMTAFTRLLANQPSSSAVHEEKWPGNRPPMPNLDQLEQRIDATWGRGKYREEIWTDQGNPVNEWWMAYSPSEEQLQAAAQGFNFSDVEEWCKVCWHSAWLFNYLLMVLK